jgi:hypothetical protein
MKDVSNSLPKATAPTAHWYRKVAGTALTAGAGVFGCPSEAQAQIVVWTPNISTTGTTGASNIYFDFVSGTAQSTPFGNAQFQLQRSFRGTGIGQAAFFYALDVNNHAIGNSNNGFFYPSRMAAGDHIGNPGPWLVAAGVNFQTLGYQNFPYGNWPSPSTGFLGLRFGDGTNFNYGWAEVSLDSNSNVTLSRFAYNTVVNQEILAGQTSSVPEPSSAALLVLGAAGLAAYRKRGSKTTESQPESTTVA